MKKYIPPWSIGNKSKIYSMCILMWTTKQTKCTLNRISDYELGGNSTEPFWHGLGRIYEHIY